MLGVVGKGSPSSPGKKKKKNFLIWLFVPSVNNAIRGYYDVTKETEWLRNRVITNISYSSSAALSSCMVVITQSGALILPRTGV